jgi:hypothetical protein
MTDNTELQRLIRAALAEHGYVASTGRPYEAAAIASMLRE